MAEKGLHGWKWQKLLGMAGIAGNLPEWLEMAGND